MKITDEQRKALLKEVSYAIGLCGSVKPEAKAESALEAIEKRFNIVLK